MELLCMVFERGAEFLLGFSVLYMLFVFLDDYLLIIPMIFICCILFVTGAFDLLNHRNLSHLIFVSIILVIFGLVCYFLFPSNSPITLRDYFNIIGVLVVTIGGGCI